MIVLALIVHAAIESRRAGACSPPSWRFGFAELILMDVELLEAPEDETRSEEELVLDEAARLDETTRLMAFEHFTLPLSQDRTLYLEVTP